MADNIGAAIQILGWILTALSILVVTGRFYVRQCMVFKLGWDDWTMLLALLMAVANMATANVSVHYGIGQHSSDLSPDNRALALKWNSFSQPTAIMGPTVGRISFALTLLGIMGHKPAWKILFYVNMVLQIAANGAMVGIVLSPCKPFERLWDKRIPGVCRPAYIQERYGYFHGAYNSAVDLGLAVAPAILFHNLQMKTRQKVGLTILMGLGVFATGASLGKVVHLKALGNTVDATWANGLLRIWALLESHVVIVAASLPTLRPLARKYLGTTTQRYGSQPTERYSLRSISKAGDRWRKSTMMKATVADDASSESSQQGIVNVGGGREKRSDSNVEQGLSGMHGITKTVDIEVNSFAGTAH